MKVTFWGVRGSIPCPGAKTLRYGGNSSCLELRLSDGTLIIFDAGTGIRPLG
jgi:phosphoribosyl 1,2-cyclic phosphodiesterase